MLKNLDQTGVLQVNGAWATSVKYESEVLGSRAGTVDLRFMQGRAEIGRVSLLTAEVAEFLGDKNAAAITRHLASDADKYVAVIKGELRGTRLHYREVRLEENAIEAGRERSQDPTSADPRKSQGPETPGTDALVDPRSERRRSQTPEADHAPGSSSRTGSVPPRIVARYLVKHDTYYFDDQTVAFVDKGSRLTVQTHNSAVLKDVMDIAKSRDWNEIHLSGTKAFRREAWNEAYAAGLKVSGYTPTEIELEAAKRARSRTVDSGKPQPPPPKPAPEPAKPSPAQVEPELQKSTPTGRRGGDLKGMVYGTLVDHGVAPYRNDPTKAASYFVTIKTAVGEHRTDWGVGLADALRNAQSQPKIGDEIGMRRAGSTPVTVLERDDEGQRIPSPIVAKRHRWQIETAEYLRADPAPSTSLVTAPARETRQAGPALAKAASPEGMTRAKEAAQAIRNAATTREELQLKYPEISRAVFAALAVQEQFADAYVKARLIRESDRAQVIAQLRERVAADLERGKRIREPQERVNSILRSSVLEAATRIGRTPVESMPKVHQPPVRDEVQVRS